MSFAHPRLVRNYGETSAYFDTNFTIPYLHPSDAMYTFSFRTHRAGLAHRRLCGVRCSFAIVVPKTEFEEGDIGMERVIYYIQLSTNVFAVFERFECDRRWNACSELPCSM